MQKLIRSESRSEQIRFIASYDTAGKRHELTLDRISDALALEDGSIIWVGLFEPDEALLFKMQIEFDLHVLAVEDAHKAHQRSKIERFGDCLFIVVNTAQIENGGIAYGETHIFLGADFILIEALPGGPGWRAVADRLGRAAVGSGSPD